MAAFSVVANIHFAIIRSRLANGAVGACKIKVDIESAKIPDVILLNPSAQNATVHSVCAKDLIVSFGAARIIVRMRNFPVLIPKSLLICRWQSGSDSRKPVFNCRN